MHVRRDMKGRCKDADRSIHSARPAAALDGYRSTSPIDILRRVHQSSYCWVRIDLLECRGSADSGVGGSSLSLSLSRS